MNSDKPKTPESREGVAAGQTPGDGHGDGAELSRRVWLSRILIGGTVAGASLVLVPAIGFLLGPVLKTPPLRWETVGRPEQFPIGLTRKVVFENISPVTWSGVVGRAAAWVRRQSETDLIAFSINCTHLGCPVRWMPKANLFMCPCHGGVYYENGDVAAGPPPKPLPRYPIRVYNGQVQIRTSPLPVTTT